MYYDILSSEFWSQHIVLEAEYRRMSRSAYLEDQPQDRRHFLLICDSGWHGYCVNVAGSNVAGSWFGA